MPAAWESEPFSTIATAPPATWARTRACEKNDRSASKRSADDARSGAVAVGCMDPRRGGRCRPNESASARYSVNADEQPGESVSSNSSKAHRGTRAAKFSRAGIPQGYGLGPE